MMFLNLVSKEYFKEKKRLKLIHVHSNEIVSESSRMQLEEINE